MLKKLVSFNTKKTKSLNENGDSKNEIINNNQQESTSLNDEASNTQNVNEEINNVEFNFNYNINVRDDGNDVEVMDVIVEDTTVSECLPEFIPVNSDESIDKSNSNRENEVTPLTSKSKLSSFKTSIYKSFLGSSRSSESSYGIIKDINLIDIGKQIRYNSYIYFLHFFSSI